MSAPRQAITNICKGLYLQILMMFYHGGIYIFLRIFFLHFLEILNWKMWDCCHSRSKASSFMEKKTLLVSLQPRVQEGWGKCTPTGRFWPRTFTSRRASYKCSFRLFFFGIKAPAWLWLSSLPLHRWFAETGWEKGALVNTEGLKGKLFNHSSKTQAIFDIWVNVHSVPCASQMCAVCPRYKNRHPFTTATDAPNILHMVLT